MKNKIKKIGAILLALTLLSSSGLIPNIVSAETTATKSGAITLHGNSSSAGATAVWFKATDSLGLANSDFLQPVKGRGGSFLNGVYYQKNLYHISEKLFRWDITATDIKVGDVLKIFGEFEVTSGTSKGTVIWLTPTVLECINKADDGKTKWKVISSAEEVEDSESTEAFLSLNDFFENASYQDTWQYGNCHTLIDSTKDIYGKTYRTFVTWEKAQRDSYTTPIFYYGCASSSGNTGIGVMVTHKGNNQNEISVIHRKVSGGAYTTLGSSITMTDEELLSENLLQIQFPAKDANDQGYLSVSINDKVLVQDELISDVSNFKNYIHFAWDNTGYSMVNKKYTEVRAQKYNMKYAPEITVADFGIADGTYTTQKSGSYAQSIVGKKLVLQFDRNADETARVFMHYGNLYFWYQENSTYDYLIVSDASKSYKMIFSKAYVNEAKIEVYCDKFYDADEDGIKDDALFYFSINDTFMEAYPYTLADALYTKPSITLGSNSSNQYKVQSLNTHASATIKDGILTISGTGIVYPSVVSRATTDGTDIKEIRIEEGITAVSSGVFSNLTKLELVNYANTVVSVSDTAFTGCASNVKVLCAEGKKYAGGLENPIFVDSFEFQTLELERVVKTNTSMTVELAPSIVVKGTAKEGKLSATTYTGLKAEVNGVAQEVVLTKTSYGTLACTYSTADITEDAYEVMIKSGLLNSDDGKVHLALKKDFTIYVNENGISANQAVTHCGTRKLSVRSSQTSQIYLLLDQPTDDGIALKGNLIAQDDAASGIFLNGEKIDVTLAKYSSYNTIYYLGLYDKYRNQAVQEGLEQDLQAHEGDMLTINGTFRCEDRMVTFEPYTIQYNGTKWVTVTPTDNQISLPDTTVDIEEKGIGYSIEKGNVSIRDDEGTKQVTDGTTLYKPGDYIVTRTMNEVSYEKYVSLYRRGDVNTNNEIGVTDIVALKKCQNDDAAYGTAAKAAASLTEGTTAENVAVLHGLLLNTDVMKDGAVLPKELEGQQLGNATMQEDENCAPTYITSVDATNNGTAVFSMSDTYNSQAPYASTKEQMSKFDDYGLDYVINMETNRELRVLQLTDTQIIDRTIARTVDRQNQVPVVYVDENRDKLLTEYMDKAVQATDPDLILLTGDNVFGEFDDNGAELAWLIEKMDSYGILWAPIFGNHDNESRIGVLKQCEMFQKSKYCLFNRRHAVGGNGNYTIGLAKGGELKRTLFMMDTNSCAVASTDTAYPDKAEISHPTTPKFVWQQVEWYRDMAKRINDVDGKIVPSFMAYHIPTYDIYLAELAAGYATSEQSTYTYSIGEDVEVAQVGDCGKKTGSVSNSVHAKVNNLLKYMNEVGTDGTFFGHEHSNSTSVYYAGVRWTYGVKTGMYDSHPKDELGGTLITLSDDYANFDITRITFPCNSDMCAGKH